jgi:uncharacterized membrane protein YoaK (UPF0700 family)
MWRLAIGAGIVANVAGVFLAAACSRAGWRALSRLVQLMRWLALAAAVAAAVELSRHRSAGTATWLALAIVGGGLAVGAAALAGYAVCQFRCTPRRWQPLPGRVAQAVGVGQVIQLRLQVVVE